MKRHSDGTRCGGLDHTSTRLSLSTDCIAFALSMNSKTRTDPSNSDLVRGTLLWLREPQDKFFARWAAYIDPNERDQIVAHVAETAQLVAESRRGGT